MPVRPISIHDNLLSMLTGSQLRDISIELMKSSPYWMKIERETLTMKSSRINHGVQKKGGHRGRSLLEDGTSVETILLDKHDRLKQTRSHGIAIVFLKDVISRDQDGLGLTTKSKCIDLISCLLAGIVATLIEGAGWHAGRVE
ncbi:hypothetical protein Tco_1436841 [Tanacetum coccineum]